MSALKSMRLQCRACLSPHRREIDTRLKANESARSIGRWLDQECGERIPHNALANHKRKHLGSEHIVAFGKTLTIEQLAELSGLSVNSVSHMLCNGFSPEQVLERRGPHRPADSGPSSPWSVLSGITRSMSEEQVWKLVDAATAIARAGGS